MCRLLGICAVPPQGLLSSPLSIPGRPSHAASSGLGEGVISSRWCLHFLGPNPENVIEQIVEQANTCFTSWKWKYARHLLRGPTHLPVWLSIQGTLVPQPLPIRYNHGCRNSCGEHTRGSRGSCVLGCADSENQGSGPPPPVGALQEPSVTLSWEDHGGPQGKAALGAWGEEMALTSVY